MNLDVRSAAARIAGLPVLVAALSLMTGTVITALLGLVFWFAFAPNLFDTGAVGTNSTALSSIMILADVACLGLRTGLVRYVPRAGRVAGGTIAFGYAVASGLSAVVAVVFLAGLPIWGERLGMLTSSWPVTLYVVASCVCWSVFMLQDSVLVALRKSSWVPIENTIFSAAKLFLLFPFSVWSPELGIFWAWTAPVFPVVIVVNVLIVRELRRSRSNDEEPETAENPVLGFGWPGRSFVAEIMRFSFADWISALARLAAILVIPLLVLSKLDEEQAGYFNVAWLMAYALFSVSSNAAYALLGDPSDDRQHLSRNSVQAGALSMAFTSPAVIVGIVAAPLILRIAGQEFADNSLSLLRLLLIAAVPNVVHQIYIGHLRSQGRMRALIAAELALASVGVIGTWYLLDPLGIVGVGVAWLIGVSVLAAYALISESAWWWASWIGTNTVRGIGGLLHRLPPNGPTNAAFERLEAAARFLGAAPSTAHWIVDRGSSPEATIPSAEPDETFWILMATNADAAGELDQIESSLAEFSQAVAVSEAQGPELAVLRNLTPDLLHRHRGRGEEFSVWSERSGRTAEDWIHSGWAPSAMVQAMLPTIEALRCLGTDSVVVDREAVESWLEPGVDTLRAAGAVSPGQTAKLIQAVLDGLGGTTVQIGWVHGGLVAGNILLGDDPMEPVGLRGWGRCRPSAPLLLDRGLLALSEIARVSNLELGEAARDVLRDPTPFAQHDAIAVDPPSEAEARAMVIMVWLDFISRPHSERRFLGPQRIWLARNARPVLTLLESASWAPEPLLAPAAGEPDGV